ncbi:ANL family adenylate-forming protein [Agromyces salentinus]|uniref:AMP-binding enzyme C-terminal domain-containing protein n=1 Tax=Agromyces salentinus TaxID=269421 RepID=A0ABP4YZG0_9MICO|nr:fatty acid--CoA ligase family protein [Agromyces salentinus]
MSDWLGGSPRDVALDFGGDAMRYAELSAAASSAELPPGDGLVACPPDLEASALVVRVLAALDRRRPVLVGGTSDHADRLAGELPAGTELALLTSGSSGGAPRVVARTNESWLASADALSELAGIGCGDRVAATGPLHVSMHLYAVLHALRLGATATDGLSGATVAHATPTRLARLLGNRDCPPSVVVAGAALSPELRERAGGRGIRLTEYYGAAELSFVLGGRDGDLRPFPGVEIDVRRAGAATGDSAGELWARSPYLALGVVGGGMLRRDERGFATVGDLVEPSGAGGWRVLGRGDAAITTAGATVLAEQVEARILELPGVLAAGVVGEPHDLLGERVAAVVELADGTSVDEVAAAARSRLTPAELPRRWYVAPVPQTTSGKVARGELRRAVDEGRLEASARVMASGGDA